MHSEYVLAARAAGRRPFAIGLRHVLPNVGGLVIVQASVAFAIAVLAEAALSFLGLGTPPPTPSWGRMLQESQELLFIAPRLCIIPGIAIAVAVLGFNLLGDGLRDYLDPRLEDRDERRAEHRRTRRSATWACAWHDTDLVADVSILDRRGERVGLIGESGSGKSLTGLSLMGLLPEELVASGSVRPAGLGPEVVGAGDAALSRVRGGTSRWCSRSR